MTVIGPARIAGILLALTLIALCGAPARATPFQVTGVEEVTAQSRMDSDSGKGAQATCPNGKKVIGTAGAILPFSTGLIMNEVFPNAALTSVNTFGWEEENRTLAPWYARAQAVCADPLPGMQRVTATGSHDSARTKSQTVRCPVGKHVIGLGGRIEGAEGEVLLERLATEETLIGAVITATEDATGTADNWRLQVYAICAEPVLLQKLVNMV